MADGRPPPCVPRREAACVAVPAGGRGETAGGTASMAVGTGTPDCRAPDRTAATTLIAHRRVIQPVANSQLSQTPTDQPPIPQDT